MQSTLPEPPKGVKKVFAKLNSARSAAVAKYKAFVKAGKVVPVSEKVNTRHLELEPLCCLSSCLVRGGCSAVVGFEMFHVALTLLVVTLKVYDGGRFHFWLPFENNFNALVTHPVSLYAIIAFDLVQCIIACLMARGLITFEKQLLLLHLRFDYFALGFNVVFFCLYVLGLSAQGPETWTGLNGLLVFAFAFQIPMQVWAISVVKSCYDFFVLIHVFISLADA